MILLKDGVRYEEWTPPDEATLAGMVKEHYRDIWGKDSIYFDIRHKVKGSAVAGIPDGYVITFDPDEWWIVEIELSTHDVFNHIDPQISKFIAGIKREESRREIADILYSEIDANEPLKLDLQRRRGGEIFKFIYSLIRKDPKVLAIIDKHVPALEDLIKARPGVIIREFRTFCREGVGIADHIHLFEPLFEPKPKPPIIEGEKELVTIRRKQIEIVLNPFHSYKIYNLIRVRKELRSFFPGYEVPFILETDVGEIETHFTGASKETLRGDPLAGAYFTKGLSKWYQAHPELKEGDILIIEEIEPHKRYRLSIKR